MDSTGLAGISAGETAISTVGKEGRGLTYRGYSIQDLADKSTFEEVAYLLINGALPTSPQLKDYQNFLKASQGIPAPLFDILEQIPETGDPMDVLRTACSLLGILEPESKTPAAKQIASRLMPFCISALLYWYHFVTQNKRVTVVTDASKLASHFLNLLYQKQPDEEQIQALDISLILYAEHEFNASTFAARVCISTETDFYSAIVAAIGTLRGRLHGGANEAAMELISSFKDPDAAEKGIRERINNKQLIMGFGHRVYKNSDPRSEIIKVWAKRLADRHHDTRLFPIAERIEKVMWDEKNLFPNLDFYSALVYHFLGIPTELFTPLFAVSRISGWSAHIIEQRTTHKLIRPVADYTGPELSAYMPIEKR